MKILIIENDRHIRSCIKLKLEREGHIVHEYNSGKGALKFVEQLNPDITITDYDLGEGDNGLKIAATLISKNKLAILMSADGRIERNSWDMGVPFVCQSNIDDIFDMIEVLGENNI